MAMNKGPFFLMVLIAILWGWPEPANGEHPLLAEEVSIGDVGPRTERVDLAGYAQVYYVKPGEGQTSQGKGTHDEPFTTLVDALEVAGRVVGNDARAAVLVSAGGYKGPPLHMTSHVDLFGGFDQDFKERDIFRFPSVLEGSGMGPVVVCADDACLDGFVVTGGNNRGSGGGIVCDHASPVLSNNFIHHNQTLEPKGFERDLIHQYGNDGGGISILRGASPMIRNNLIYENRTEIGIGAGLAIWDECPKPRILHNVFLHNEAGVTGRDGKAGSRSSNGGAIAVSKNCHPEIAGNILLDNRVYDNSDGGGIYLEYDAHAVIRGNWIIGNRGADDGGGMYIMKNSEPLLERNIFAGNQNTTGGSGGIRLSKEGRMRASHNLLLMNPGTIDAVATWMVLTHNTLVGATNESIIFENQAPHLMPSRIEGNLIAGTGDHTLNIKVCVTGLPLIENNLIRGGYDGNGNVDLDPGFLDDSYKGEILETHFDAVTQTTRIQLAGPSIDPKYAGFVFHMGETWSVVKETGGNDLVVWGQLQGEGKEFMILPSYRPMADDSPAAIYGAYANKSK